VAEAGNASARITRIGSDYHVSFHAMATPCELRVETDDGDLARRIGAAAEHEARRIEAKFSRYRADSVVGKINAAGHQGLVLDGETASLIDCAEGCYQASNGLFDITSGILRRAWRFDGSANIPSPEKVRSLMSLVGWSKVSWKPPEIVLPAGMEIDLGGLAKEYAVDRALAEALAVAPLPMLVNFGGDLKVSGPRKDGAPWNVAIESTDEEGRMAAMLELGHGALATSGDARRFLLRDGVRYGHILDPRTGWPVTGAPRSVTVAAASCVEAGLSATLAILQGEDAEAFLKREEIKAWCIR
jgi:thiamine biosynthesis lipoprotein